MLRRLSSCLDTALRIARRLTHPNLHGEQGAMWMAIVDMLAGEPDPDSVPCSHLRDRGQRLRPGSPFN
jgi:hypothetical protein